jgi:hypothetical protein
MHSLHSMMRVELIPQAGTGVAEADEFRESTGSRDNHQTCASLESGNTKWTYPELWPQVFWKINICSLHKKNVARINRSLSACIKLPIISILIDKRIKKETTESVRLYTDNSGVRDWRETAWSDRGHQDGQAAVLTSWGQSSSFCIWGCPHRSSPKLPVCYP